MQTHLHVRFNFIVNAFELSSTLANQRISIFLLRQLFTVLALNNQFVAAFAFCTGF